MIERQVEIINRLGLHARAAAKLVHEADRYTSRIQLASNGQEVDAKSILGILLLAAAQGTVLRIRCDGEDEEQALQALVELIGRRFGEDR